MSAQVVRRLDFARAALLAAVTALSLIAVPAHAWTSKYQHFHVRMRNNTGADVNDIRVRVQVRSGGAGAWGPPLSLGTMVQAPGWAFTGAAVVGNSLVYTFAAAPGFFLHAGQTGWFNVYFCIPGNTGPWESHCWFQWTLNGALVGQEVHFGYCVSSPAKLGDPDIRWDGSVNTSNTVIRNLQFAMSPHALTNDETTLDNPAVIALFNASSDPIRPGPLTTTPGNCVDIASMHPSITGPVDNGATVLARGTAADASDNQYDFVVQFEGLTGPGLPATSKRGLFILALALAALGAYFIARRRTARAA